MPVSIAASPGRFDDRARRWTAAATLALVWHLVVIGGLTQADLFDPEPVTPRNDPIEVVFAPTAPTAATSADEDAPEYFTELPEDRADQPPERADALSNVDSRARDAVDDGGATTDLPRLDGRSDAPAVGMQPAPAAQEQGAEGTTPAPSDPSPSADPRAEAAEPLSSERTDRQTGRRAQIGDRIVTGETGATRDEAPRFGEGLGNPADAMQRGAVEVSPEPRFLVGAGRDDVFQEEMANPRGDARLFGDVSLNTIAWDWAPWLQRFTRSFYRNWVPPYAYFLGLIDGNQLVEIEVAPDGRLLRLEVLEESGHESLREATVGNFRGFAPYHPLPDDFPEPTLRLTVRVTYPGRD